MRREVEEVNDAIFAELTYHAAYEPVRAVRTERWKYIRRFGDRLRPVLPNVDDSPTKDLLLADGWGDIELPREALHDLRFDPVEAHNLIDAPHCAEIAAELRERLDAWMRETEDPLLDGPVAAARGRGAQQPGPDLARRAGQRPRARPGGVGALAPRPARGYFTPWMNSTSFWTSSGLFSRSKPSMLAVISPALKPSVTSASGSVIAFSR